MSRNKGFSKKGTFNFFSLIIALLLPLSILIFPKTALEGKEKDITMNRLLEIINEKRALGGVCGEELFMPSKPLKWDPRLSRAAFIHALDLAERDILSHKGQDGSDPGERIRSAGYKWKAYGENIGEGYSSAKDMLKAWMKSEGHCKNIMNPHFKDAGAARVIKNKRTYWVLVLATPY